MVVIYKDYRKGAQQVIQRRLKQPIGIDRPYDLLKRLRRILRVKRERGTPELPIVMFDHRGDDLSLQRERSVSGREKTPLLVEELDVFKMPKFIGRLPGRDHSAVDHPPDKTQA